MKPAFLALLFSCVLGSPALAIIREAATLAEVLRELDDDALLALDLDNTVIRSAGDHGSDASYDFLVQRYLHELGDRGPAVRRAMAEWATAQETTEVIPVEADTARLIASAQRARRRLMGLTARTPDMAPRTRTQLAGAGVDFNRAPIAAGALELSPEELFTGGVLYVGPGRSKGAALLAFLERIGLRPSRVLFADDKLHYVTSVDEALTAAGISVIAFRYGGADALVRDFWARACLPGITRGGLDP